MDQAYVNQECLIEFSLWDGAAMLTGQAVTVSIERDSDGKYWNADDAGGGVGAGWEVGYVANNMTERVGNVHLEGKYQFTLPAAAVGETPDVFRWSSKVTIGGTDYYNRGDVRTSLNVTSQFIRDALTLAPSSGAPGVGSIDDLLENLPAGVLAETVDGITVETLLECIMAVACGEATVLGSVISFKKRDGVTNRIQITVGTTEGERTASTIV